MRWERGRVSGVQIANKEKGILRRGDGNQT